MINLTPIHHDLLSAWPLPDNDSLFSLIDGIARREVERRWDATPDTEKWGLGVLAFGAAVQAAAELRALSAHEMIAIRRSLT